MKVRQEETEEDEIGKVVTVKQKTKKRRKIGKEDERLRKATKKGRKKVENREKQ